MSQFFILDSEVKDGYLYLLIDNGLEKTALKTTVESASVRSGLPNDRNFGSYYKKQPANEQWGGTIILRMVDFVQANKKDLKFLQGPVIALPDLTKTWEITNETH